MPRRRMNKKRRASHQGAVIGGTTTIVSIGRFDDGEIGEVFFDLDMHKEGAPLRTMANVLSRAVSLGLQHGVPVASFVKLFADVRFDPAGEVFGHVGITEAKSIVDYLSQVLAAAAKETL
jgi:ribonucleoside-diphosphate reductase alpha chain